LRRFPILTLERLKWRLRVLGANLFFWQQIERN
jgi:hypothetical protein